ILSSEAFTDIEDALLAIDDNVAAYYIEQTKSIADIDFLHGAFGAAFYLVERLSDNKDFSFQEKVIKLFELLCNIILYEIKETDKVKELRDITEETHVTNCGLAHGHISYILILSKFLEHFPKNELVRETLTKSVQCVLEFESTNANDLSQFPSIAVNAKTANYTTSLGWCYGDQTISLGLYKAAGILKDASLKEKALHLAYINLARNTTDKMFSSRDNYDACLCHGLTSVAYIHKKWYSISKDEKFFNEYERLAEDVLKFGENKKGIGGYQKRLGDGKLEDSVGLLDGIIGIGMFFIDYLLEFDDCGWDNLFLLDVQ
ncbi:MAG: lanthionine synthetase LanC family protein, partial [Flavobacterium sp.]